MFEAGDYFRHQSSSTAIGAPSAATYDYLLLQMFFMKLLCKMLIKYTRHVVYYKRYIDNKCIFGRIMKYESDVCDNFGREVT